MKWIAVIALLVAWPTTAEDALDKDLVGYGELKEEWRGRVVHLSWRPRTFLYKKFLTDKECDHIINLAKPKMEVAEVVNSDTGETEPSEVRTSTGMFLEAAQDEVVAAIEKRVSQVTMTPLENQECIQVLRYLNGQKYEAHHDFFHDDVNKGAEVGGQRVVTALMYLSTPEEGGETVFPDSTTQTPRDNLSECVQRGLAYKPVKGDLLIFYSLFPNGTEDEASLHESCPTLKGEKWSATVWIHVGRYMERDTEGKPVANEKGREPPPTSSCRDDNDMCAEWAYFGECEKNPPYMLESCKLSCNVCVSPPSPIDVEKKR